MATSNRASIKLYNVQGIARLSGNDSKDGNGCEWLQQFWGEIEDSAIESYYMCEDATESKAIAGAWRACLEHCCICGRRIAGDAWANLDCNGELACDSHVKIVTRA